LGDQIEKNEIERGWGKGEVLTGFWWGNLREIDHLEDPGANVKIILRWIFKKENESAWTGLFWIRTAIGGRHL
jgi:hypothetical protein